MPIDINLFRKDKGGDVEKLLWNQRVRNHSEQLIHDIIDIDSQWVKADFAVNQLNRDKNATSKQVGEIKKKQAQAKKSNNIDEINKLESEFQSLIDTSKQLDSSIVDAQKHSDTLQLQLNKLLKRVGNIVDSTVPISNDESNNTIERTHGLDKRRYNNNTENKLYHHHELLYMIDGYSPEQGVNVAGHRGYFLKNVGVLLNQALISYALQFLMKRSYTALQPPYFMKKDIMSETAQLEEFDEALYNIKGDTQDDELYLIATSEQPISAYHRHEWLSPSDLPIKYAGISTCFRKEAGSHGKDAWGIFRIHQFEKIEQFAIVKPDDSSAMHNELINVCEEFYQSLGISYQIINIVSGALNNAASKKLDLEAWFPTLGVFRELVSASNCTDYQSRAMETRYNTSGGKKNTATQEKTYVHMLNATLCATERTICCILENYQTDTGVVVPEVLRPYMGMDFMPFIKPAPKHSVQSTSNNDKTNKQKT